KAWATFNRPPTGTKISAKPNEDQNQNSQPNDFMFSRAISLCRLQAAATVLLSELAMSCFQVRAKASMFSLYSAFFAAGTWSEIQELYFAMKSSHSGMPIFSLPPAVAPAELTEPFADLELVLLLVTNPAHPFRKNTDTTRTIKMVFADIWLLRISKWLVLKAGRVYRM